jgi:hypothetical protein
MDSPFDWCSEAQALAAQREERLFALEVENYLEEAAEPDGVGPVFAYWLKVRRGRTS